MKKHKKGFTLVEIILVLAIMSIVVIGGIIVTKKNDNGIKELTDIVIEAASVYINIEKDNYGSSYEQGILNGAKGIQISLNTLVDKGYISNDIKKDISNKTNNNNLYIFVSRSIKNNDDKECESALFEYNVSWENTDESIYLCPYKKTESEKSTKILNKLLLNNEIKLGYPNWDEYDDSEKGLYILPDENGNSIYYYGNVSNNYLKFNNMIWRIIRLDGNGNLRIILDEPIKNIKLEKGDKITVDYTNNFYILNSDGTTIDYDYNKEIICFDTGNGGSEYDACFYDFELSYENSPPVDVLLKKGIPIYFGGKTSYSSGYYKKMYKNSLLEWYKKNFNEEAKNKIFIREAKSNKETTIDGIGSSDSNCEIYNELGYGCHISTEIRYYSIYGLEFISKVEKKYAGDTNSYLKNEKYYPVEHSSGIWIGNNKKRLYYEYNEAKIDNKIGSSINKYKYKYSEIEKYFPENEINSNDNYIKLGVFDSVTKYKFYGLKPVITLKNNLCYKGEGTENNPYEIIDC